MLRFVADEALKNSALWIRCHNINKRLNPPSSPQMPQPRRDGLLGSNNACGGLLVNDCAFWT